MLPSITGAPAPVIVAPAPPSGEPAEDRASALPERSGERRRAAATAVAPSFTSRRTRRRGGAERPQHRRRPGGRRLVHEHLRARRPDLFARRDRLAQGRRRPMTQEAAAHDQSWMLSDVADVPGVQHAVVLSADGLVRARTTGPRRRRRRHACRGGRRTAVTRHESRGTVRRGRPKQHMIEWKGGFLFLRGAGDGSRLAVITSNKVDPGSDRLPDGAPGAAVRRAPGHTPEEAVDIVTGPGRGPVRPYVLTGGRARPRHRLPWRPAGDGRRRGRRTPRDRRPVRTDAVAAVQAETVRGGVRRAPGPARQRRHDPRLRPDRDRPPDHTFPGSRRGGFPTWTHSKR